MATEKLNAKKVAALKEPGRYGDGNGLWLIVSKTGARRWAYRFRRPDTGAPTEMGLGSADNVTLAEAREAAAAARKQRHVDGANPIQTRARAERGEGRIPSFKEAADDYVKANSPDWRNPKHRDQWEMTLRVYCAPLHKIPVNEITTKDIVDVLKTIWHEKNETATRVRGRIEMILDRARTLGYIDPNARNPAQWKGHLDNVFKSAKRKARGHHASLPYTDLPQFMNDLRSIDVVASKALEFTILTAARTGETLGAKWSEIDLDAKTWTIPAERMKAGKEHVVPLSPAALAILETMYALRSSEYIFPGAKRNQPLSNMSMEMVLRRMDKKDVATVHGFRSTFRDWGGDKTDFYREVLEAALAHAIADKAEAAYRRNSALEKRRELMVAWADYCASA